MLKKLILITGLMLGGFALSGCQSSEDRAEEHYQTGMTLLASGDVDRALVEFRNVFKLNGRHLEARLAYAKVERDRGQANSAYSQYLRVVEQYPDNFEALKALAELTLDGGNWPELRRYVTAAQAINPDDPMIQAILAASDYQAALAANDDAARSAAVAKARTLIPELPDTLVPRRVVIDHLLRVQDWNAARAELGAAINIKPDLRDLYALDLGVLAQLKDNGALEARLLEMTERFADDPTVHATLVRWYISQGKVDEAEAHMRAEVTRHENDPEKVTDARMMLVRFLAQVRSPDVARAELEQIIASKPDKVLVFRALRAGLDFEAGKRSEAIEEMTAILTDATPSIETHGIRLGLAKMLFTTGNQVGARAEVEQVLSEDSTQVEALKLKANWLINDDHTGDAMLSLRAALDQSPRDPEVMTLMARVHERDGNRDLMGDMLSLAVEASNRAPEETLRYASFLAADQKYLAAEETLVNAIRLNPANLQILSALGVIYMDMKDWPRAQQVISQLNGMSEPDAKARANDLTVRLYASQRRGEEMIGFLEGLSAEGQGGLGADAAIIRSYLASNKIDEALVYSEKVLAEDPANPARRFIHASVLGLSGKDDEAEKVYRALLDENDKQEPVWQALYGLEVRRGDKEAAGKVIDAALSALPKSQALRWAKASILQLQGDLDGAIATYEELYADNSSSMVFANNLASLLSTARTDPESLERAFVVGRRLRGAPVPAYQDTYGWIAFRRGNLDEALTHLEPAAKGLPSDPAAQYHLGMTYARLGRPEEAEAQFAAAEALIDPAQPPDYLEEIRAERARLKAEADGTKPADGN